METRPVVAVALAVLFVTAGCQAPAEGGGVDGATDAPATAAPTTQAPTQQTTQQPTEPTDSPETGTESTDGPAEVTQFVRVEDELLFRVTPIYQRVGRLLAVDEYDRPATTVYVENASEAGNVSSGSTSGFTALVGISPRPSGGDDGGVKAGAVTRGTTVTLYDYENATARWKENVLAHEFVHVYQSQLPVRDAVDALDRRRNRPFLKSVMVEGSAEYVQERYAVRYQNETIDQTRISAAWKNASAYERLRIAPYTYGSRYFAMRLDGPSGVTDVYEHPPRTAEQVVHGYDPGEEPPEALTVHANASDGGFEDTGAGTRGELFVRLALSTELDWERAADASTGWGMDRLVYFTGEGGRDAYAWVLRWDSASEATEFTDAFEDYDDANDERFRVESVTDETVVVYAGADAFVENASASGNSSSVTITA
ncbi:MAG: hypothetical protein ABEH83_04510 [Halobacterium sp.]